MNSAPWIKQISGMLVGVIGFACFAAIAYAIGSQAYSFLGEYEQFLLPITAAIFLGFVTPVTIVAVRHQVRLSRIKLINLFADALDLSVARPAEKGAAAPQGNREGVPSTRYGKQTLLSFEFVKGKYYVDLDLKEGEEPKLETIPRFPMMLHSDWMLLICALPMIAFSAFGAFLLFVPVVNLLEYNGDLEKLPLWPSMLTLGGASLDIINNKNPEVFAAEHVNTLTVGALAFAGAYFYSIRLLLRAVTVFDLSPVTFLRCFAHMVLAMLLAIVAYRVFPSMEGAAAFLNEGAAVFNQPPPLSAGEYKPAEGVKSIWLILSFALGFIPDSALEYVLRKSGVAFKQRYTELDAHAKTIPLTLLDGVDPYIAFRMEESNIFDVQNLATFNPIMLHIESPFGIYQTIDWVGQAQLCTMVGPERFLALKMLNIRTIFDLERAVRTKDIEDDLVRAVGAIMVGDCARDKATRSAFNMEGTSSLAASGAPLIKDVLEFRNGLSTASIKRLVWLMADDLHVHRLRQIWLLIREKLGDESDSFDEIDAEEEQAARRRVLDDAHASSSSVTPIKGP